MMYHAKELKINVQNMQFDYITFGNGTKPLVMIQGLNTRGIKGAAFSLAYMYRIFAKDYKVYLFDRRPVVQDGITVKEMASDIAIAMDTLGIKNADVFGVSQGGMIAQYLAMDRPDLVRKLVLAVTLSQNNSTVKQVISDWIEMAERGAMRELVADMAEKMYSDAYVKRYRLFLPLLTLLQKPKDVERFVILAKACLTCNTYESLDKIKCPVLVLGGRQDKVVTGMASEEIAKKLGCEIHMYDGLGHAAYEETKDFNQRVYDFFYKTEWIGGGSCMNDTINMSVSPVCEKGGKRYAFVTFSDGKRFAEGKIPDCEIISNQGFGAEEIEKLKEYMKKELATLKRMAAGVNVFDAFMK